MSCEQCHRLQKRLRILQSDLQFEIRKLKEDNSTEKALFEVGLQKQLKKWQEKYQKERTDRQEDNKKWLKKIDQVIYQAEKSIKDSKQSAQKMVIECQMKRQREVSQLTKILEEKRIEQVRRITENHNKQKNQIEHYYQQMVQKTQSNYTIELQSLRVLSKEREQTMKNQYDSYILGLKSEKNAEQRCNIKIQEEFRLEKFRLISEIYDLKGKFAVAEQTIKQKEAQIQRYKQNLVQKDKQVQRMEETHRLQMEEQLQQRERQKAQAQSRMEKKMAQLYQNELKLNQKYSAALDEIQQKRKQQMELYKLGLQQAKGCIESRPSRNQDVEEIAALKQKLLKSQKQSQSLLRQLRGFQLELENKEDTYNKIFIPTVASAHLPPESSLKRRELRSKRPGKSISTMREVLGVNPNTNNLPLLNSLEKKLLPPKSTKIL